MAKAIEAGLPKLRIEEAAARTQARIDAGAPVGDRRQQVPARRRGADRRAQGRQLGGAARCRSTSSRGSRRERDAARRRARRSTRSPARRAGGNGNLLALAIDAARAKATVGEISLALEKVFGRHVAEIRAISGVYRQEAGAMSGSGSDAVERVLKQVAQFEADEGRRPRILVAKIGQDGHDRGQKVIASAFADLGFDVDIGPLFATPGGGGAPGGRERRAHRRRLVARRRPSHAGAGAQGGARRAGPRRHHDRGRRRGAAAGLRRAQGGRRRGDLPARHRDRRLRPRSCCASSTRGSATAARRRSRSRFSLEYLASRIEKPGSAGVVNASVRTALDDRRPSVAARAGVNPGCALVRIDDPELAECRCRA